MPKFIIAGLQINAQGSLNSGVSPTRYDGVILQARYMNNFKYNPENPGVAQNSTSNPIEAGVIFVDEYPRAWMVDDVTASDPGANTFTVNCHCLEGNASVLIKPVNGTTLGCVLSPNRNGLFAVYDDAYTSKSVALKASLISQLIYAAEDPAIPLGVTIASLSSGLADAVKKSVATEQTVLGKITALEFQTTTV
jgi:hypothetical protein